MARTNYAAQLAAAERKAEQLRAKLNDAATRQAQASFNGLREVVGAYAPFLTQEQRKELSSALRGTGGSGGMPGKKAGGKSGGTLTPKYQLPTGETWAGRGRAHGAFTAWSRTAEGRAWHKANPDQKFPAYPFNAAGKAARGKKVAKKSNRATAKRAAPAKKGVRKTAKRSGRKAVKRSK